MSAIYLMVFEGREGVAGGLIYIGKGVIAGADEGLVTYEGNYVEEGGRLRGAVEIKAPPGIVSKLGLPVGPLGAHWSATLDLPSNFATGLTHHLTVEGQHVAVIFRKILAVPE